MQNRLNPIASVKSASCFVTDSERLRTAPALAIKQVSTIAINVHETLHERARVLGGDRFGSIWIDRDGASTHDPGYSDWRVTRSLTCRRCAREPCPHPAAHVGRAPADRCDAHAAFDKALTEALSSARIDQWARRPAGKPGASIAASIRGGSSVQRRLDGRIARTFPGQECCASCRRLQTNLLIASSKKSSSACPDGMVLRRSELYPAGVRKVGGVGAALAAEHARAPTRPPPRLALVRSRSGSPSRASRSRCARECRGPASS